MTTKNPSANRACWDWRTDTYMTSIVLTLGERNRYHGRGDIQKNRIVGAEWPKDAKKPEHP